VPATCSTVEAPAHLGDRVPGARIRDLEILVCIDVREHGQRVLEVVENDQRVGEHQREVGDADRVRVGVAERLHRAHEVVGEHTHRATREGGQIGERCGPESPQCVGSERVRIAGVAE
jgi:hypothetical protein